MTLVVRESPGKGRGVFSQRGYTEGQLIERAHVIVVPGAEWEHLKDTTLNYYCYSWGAEPGDVAVGLGHSSLYNHSFTPNAVYVKRYPEPFIDFFALRNIEEGEEITINYNGSPTDRSPMQFDVVGE